MKLSHIIFTLLAFVAMVALVIYAIRCIKANPMRFDRRFRKIVRQYIQHPDSLLPEDCQYLKTLFAQEFEKNLKLVPDQMKRIVKRGASIDIKGKQVSFDYVIINESGVFLFDLCPYMGIVAGSEAFDKWTIVTDGTNNKKMVSTLKQLESKAKMVSDEINVRNDLFYFNVCSSHTVLDFLYRNNLIYARELFSHFFKHRKKDHFPESLQNKIAKKFY